MTLVSIARIFVMVIFHRVYKVGTTEELTVRWKTFQPGQVSLSLMNEGGGVSNDFGVEMKSGGNDATAYLLCLTVGVCLFAPSLN